MSGKSHENPKAHIDRRNMLLATASLAQVPLLTQAQAAKQPAGADDTPVDARQPRYHESAHVRMFYERSRF